MSFQENLRFYREQKGYTAKELSELIEIPYSTYLNYEKINQGRRTEPRYETLCKIAKVLKVTTDELLSVPKPSIDNCPFCGSDNVRIMEVYTGPMDDDGYQVTCDGCDACGGIEKTEKDALNKWNSVYRKE